MAAVTALTRADTQVAPADNTVVSVRIRGMTCASCVGRLEKAIRAVPGVASAAVNLATERADAVFAGVPDAPAVVRAVEAAGYEVATETVAITIEGMTCASCVGRIEKALKSVPGVVGATANLATGRASVQVISGVGQAADLEAAVRRAEIGRAHV